MKCALLHPHHVLPKVLALVNAFKDEQFIEGKKNSISSSPRTDAAMKLIQKMKQYHQLRDIIVQMERMFDGMTKIHVNYCEC